jgi:hypothetical protein
MTNDEIEEGLKNEQWRMKKLQHSTFNIQNSSFIGTGLMQDLLTGKVRVNAEV